MTAVLLCAASVVYATEYKDLETKARRFFEQQEWASASAMYDLMLQQRPGESKTYGHAIVSAGMRGDTVVQMSLMSKSIQAHVPFDSIFHSVRQVGFEVGKTAMYEQFLLLIQRHEPWLSRNIDRYLLEYYDFRNDAPMMIFYSRKMLQGLPGNIEFMTVLARGLMLNGQYVEGVDAYEEILRLSPDDYNSLLQLGNYYQLTAQTDAGRKQALYYFKKARNIKTTPYVENMINQLENDIKQAK